MKIVDAIATILKHEGVKFLSCFPTTSIIQACAAAGIRPQVCAQERVGVGIADGYSRITNGHPVGVFAMQYGPGAENAFPGVATAFSDSTRYCSCRWGISGIGPGLPALQLGAHLCVSDQGGGDAKSGGGGVRGDAAGL